MQFLLLLPFANLRSFMVYTCHVLGFEFIIKFDRGSSVCQTIPKVVQFRNWNWFLPLALNFIQSTVQRPLQCCKWTCSYNLKCIQFTIQYEDDIKWFPDVSILWSFLFEPRAGKTFHPTPLRGSSAKCERKFLYLTFSNSGFINYLIKEQAWKLSPSTRHHKNL
jgi:hypothetical protein